MQDLASVGVRSNEAGTRMLASKLPGMARLPSLPFNRQWVPAPSKELVTLHQGGVAEV